MLGIRRRDFISVLGGAAAWPVAARGQQQLRRVGVLMNDVATDANMRRYMATFVEQLRKLGWIDGRNLHVEYRWNGGDAVLARTYAAELVGLNLDVIMSSSTTNLLNLQRLSPKTPIVFIQVSDPVEQGFVLNMAHPGGNITGFTAYEFTIGGKWLDLLKQLVPATTHVAVMFNPQTSPQSKFFMKSIETAAPGFGVRVAAVPLQSVADIDPAIANFSRQPNSGLIFPTDSFTVVNRKPIVEAAARHRVPAIYANMSFVQDGGLLRYGPVTDDQYRQAAVYVDRILKGTSAGDLPVQAPTKYSLVINLKAARDLGIEVPLSLLLFADEQIE
jgi:putative ABC transport system substrate-binding protein